MGHSLADGVLLEHSGTLIPWGTPMERLGDYAGSLYVPRQSYFGWQWRSVQVCGVRGNLYVEFFVDSEIEPLLWLQLDIAEGISWERDQELSAIRGHARTALSRHFRGDPHSLDGGDVWNVDGATASLTEHRDDHEFSYTEGQVSIGVLFRAPSDRQQS